ncbi:thioredoxin [Parashewanella spongiae]|uniref:Thioredoxin n=1 Tax=Parashewanella spongiae TaxID=342950 RepID=A0A3A6TF31_9GAMM|nr:thioredoxin family protein [Parashewanella spongiae]MCL1079604.1 thioredoxin family protein [Parashewanella spongiae]RJY07346.1 thioredoxin [Parashewanella spongiae]
MLTGALNLTELLAELAKFPDFDGNYQVNLSVIEPLKQIQTPTEIVVIIGTWCPDCHRDIPRFNAIINAIGNANIQVKYFGVDKQKVDVQGLAAQYEFSRLPTYIVKQQDSEIGRIIERPELTLEEDLVKLLN